MMTSNTSFEASRNCSAAGALRIRRVLLVDEHPIVRQGLRRILEGERDLKVCGEAASVHEAHAAIRECRPDAVILDFGVKDHASDLRMRELRARHPGLPLLVLSTFDESIHAERLISAGASGFIMKDAPGEQLLLALRRVLDGATYVSPSLAGNLLRTLAAKAPSTAFDPIERLSGRELQILRMIGQGMSTRETAVALHLSIKTIESHRQRIKRKLHLGTGSQLIRYALLGVGTERAPDDAHPG